MLIETRKEVAPTIHRETKGVPDSAQQLKKPVGLTKEMYRRALVDSFVKLNPRSMSRNPVMFVVEVGSVLTTALWIQAIFGAGVRFNPSTGEGDRCRGLKAPALKRRVFVISPVPHGGQVRLAGRWSSQEMPERFRRSRGR